MDAAGFGGSFAPIVQYEKREIHKVFPHFPYFRLGKNISPNLLAPLCGVALKNCPAIVGENIILPPGGATECSVEWNHVRYNTDSPNISCHVGLYRAGGYYPTLQGRSCHRTHHSMKNADAVCTGIYWNYRIAWGMMVSFAVRMHWVTSPSRRQRISSSAAAWASLPALW